MSVAQFMLELQWKQGLSLDLNTIEAWMKANAGSQYCGNQAGATLQLWFLSEPLQSVKDAINAYWAALDANSNEAKNYVNQSGRAAAAAALVNSGKAKLLALGLSQDEVNALIS